MEVVKSKRKIPISLDTIRTTKMAKPLSRCAANCLLIGTEGGNEWNPTMALTRRRSTELGGLQLPHPPFYFILFNYDATNTHIYGFLFRVVKAMSNAMDYRSSYTDVTITSVSESLNLTFVLSFTVIIISTRMGSKTVKLT